MLNASAGKMLPTTIIGSLPRPSWQTEDLGTRSFLDVLDASERIAVEDGDTGMISYLLGNPRWPEFDRDDVAVVEEIAQVSQHEGRAPRVDTDLDNVIGALLDH